MERITKTLSVIFTLFLSCQVYGQTLIYCPEVDSVPTIDGNLKEQIWLGQSPNLVTDAVASTQHQFRCAVDENSIYLSVRFADQTENRVHKSKIWDQEREFYRIGYKREDTFVLKWLIDGDTNDFTLSATQPYVADIWYWKAYRTDHVGFADDKYHVYSNEPLANTKSLIAKNGKRFYLNRKGDSGDAAYKTKILFEYSGEQMIEGYHLREPSGSRADVRAKGQWIDGYWHLEFSRPLQTNHSDDLQMVRGGRYSLGLSRYEIAGIGYNSKLDIPQFGSGDISDVLTVILPPLMAASR